MKKEYKVGDKVILQGFGHHDWVAMNFDNSVATIVKVCPNGYFLVELKNIPDYQYSIHLFNIAGRFKVKSKSVFYVNEYTNGIGGLNFKTEEEATQYGKHSSKYVKTIKFEVKK